ncbi:acetylcholine receptor subunit alpha-type acr-16-like [Episyrphus balteatus]|uniref:acetylcholine receptor subunit alpha-type acr-16-like n=1 Tax=Episyrphus balteatus TaxID=286459 RepID=UPI002486AC4E|nr:acetylcholine receptor subunit alpha-type acr-16-like [Episyrphus balteatus]
MTSCNKTLIFCYTFLILIIFKNRVQSSEIEEKLLSHLFIHYDKTVRPAAPDHTIVASIAFQLNQIEFDDAKGLFTAAAHFIAEWEDPKLKWKPSEYGNITMVHLKKHEIWLPDVSLYNSVGNKALDISDSGIMVLDNTGLVIWSMNVRMQTLCDLDMFRWPYDTHKCVIKLGSWTYDGYKIDLIPSKKLKPVNDFIENPEFVVTNFTTNRETTFYVCCSEPYITLEYYIEFARRSSAFASVFLMPAFCVVIMTLGAFWLPPHRGEKILLNGLTLLLITMYQIYFIAYHSTFSLRVPLIAIFYSLSFVMVTLSMIISVLVLASSRSLCKGHLPPGLSKILKSRIGLMFGPTDDSKKPDQTELSHHFEGGKSHETYSLICTNNSYDEWTSLGIILDRVSFIVYSGIYSMIGLVCYL